MQVIEKARDLVQVDESGFGENQTPLEWAIKAGSHVFEFVEMLMDR